MQVRNLGALVVAVDGVEQPVTGTKAAAILALLVIHVDRRVSVESLMDAAWGDRITSGTVSTLESHIWRLRQMLEPGRTARQASSILINEAGGYRLVAAGHSVDSLHFEEAARDVRELLTAGRAAAAVARADEALALWRGDPYGALGEQDWARPAVARLAEIRSELSERRIDALIAMGSLEQALADLEPLIAAMPFRERLWAQQMLALYRVGRIKQAFNSFHEARSIFIEELGTEPGPTLQDLHHRMLDNDVGLAAPHDVPTPPTRGPIEVHLPATRTVLRGRDDDRTRLADLIATRRLVTVVGAAGCGKTRLSVEVGRQIAERFTDGVWFVDLGVTTDPSLVVDVITSTIGFAASAGTTPVEDLTHYLRGRQMLLVLDNCEHVLAGIAHLVEVVLGCDDDSVACRILATSREPINIDGEMLWTLAPLESETSAVQLFLDRLRSAAPALEITAAIVRQAAAICAAVDGLPLAIELAAARARSFSLDDILVQVTTDPSGLRRIGRGPADHRATLLSAIEWSHRMLTPPEQLVHRRLSVLPGAFTLVAADAVVAEMSVAEVGDLLAQLVHRSMLDSTPVRRVGGPTMFNQLATVRSHAGHTLAAAGDLTRATVHRNRWIAELIDSRPRLGSPAEPGWYHHIDDDYPTVRAVLIDLLVDHPEVTGARMASRLGFYWYYRAKMQEAARWLDLAHNVFRRDQSVDSQLAGLASASALAVQGRTDLVRPYIREAVENMQAIPSERLIDVGESLVGVATAVWVRDEFDLVQRVHGALADVADRAGDEQLQVLSDAVGCVASIAAGQLDEAAVAGVAVYERSIALDNNAAAWIAAGPPMIAALVGSRPVEGIPWVRRVMRGHLRVDSAAGGMFIETRANFAAQLGEYQQAARFYAAARTQTRRAAMVWPRRSITEQLLRQTQNQLSAADYESAWRDGERLSLDEIARAT